MVYDPLVKIDRATFLATTAARSGAGLHNRQWWP
jgi:hypothetical protein